MPQLTVYTCPACGDPRIGRAGAPPECRRCADARNAEAALAASPGLRESLAEQAREAARHTT